MKSKIVFVLLLVFQATAFSDQLIREGVATFEFNYPDAASINSELLAKMPVGVKIYFKNNKSRAEYDNQARWINIVDGDKREILSMGTPAHDVATKSTFKEKADNQAMEFGGYTVKLTGDSKDIAGYHCKKAVVSYSGDQTMEIWFTNEIAATNTQFFFKGVNGFIMEYTHKMTLYPDIPFTEVLTCAKVEKTGVSDRMFVLPDNCKLISSDHFEVH